MAGAFHVSYIAAMPDQPVPPRPGAAARRQWPIRILRLGEEPRDDLTAVTTPEERLAMVWELTARAWALVGKPVPDYARSLMPGRVTRPS